MVWLISPIPQRKTRQTESRDEKQDPVATHRLKYADVALEMSWVENVFYNAPVLVAILGHNYVQQEHRHRALTELCKLLGLIAPPAAGCTNSKVCGGSSPA